MSGDERKVAAMGRRMERLGKVCLHLMDDAGLIRRGEGSELTRRERLEVAHKLETAGVALDEAREVLKKAKERLDDKARDEL